MLVGSASMPGTTTSAPGKGAAEAVNNYKINYQKSVLNLVFTQSTKENNSAAITVSYPKPKNKFWKLTYKIEGGFPERQERMYVGPGRDGGDKGQNNWGIVIGSAKVSEIASKNVLFYGQTLAHEVGHFLGFLHRDVPSTSGNSDGMNQPHNRNVMDIHFDDGGNFKLMPLTDFDLIQVYAAHKLASE
jgi:hypothetical protein